MQASSEMRELRQWISVGDLHAGTGGKLDPHTGTGSRQTMGILDMHAGAGGKQLVLRSHVRASEAPFIQHFTAMHNTL